MTLGPAYGFDRSGETAFTGEVEFPVGTAGTPSIRGSTDENTGFAWLGSDALIASTGGTERFRIDSGGLAAFSSAGTSTGWRVVADPDATGAYVARDLGTTKWALGWTFTGSSSASGLQANGNGCRLILRDNSNAIGVFLHSASSSYINGNFSVGTTSLDATARLQVDSTTRGFLPPRMTTTQRDAISSPATGLQIYNTTTNKINVYTGSGWEAVTSA